MAIEAPPVPGRAPGAARPRPKREREEEVLVWPDLVFVEFISAVLFTITFVILSVLINAPLLNRANTDVTPNPSKAPWYFLNLQELLLHMDKAWAGVLLPTLSHSFRRVVLVDLEARQAGLVQKKYGLSNVEIFQADAASLDFSAAPFDAAVAADVLEHFQDLSLPLNLLRRWIRPGGMLFTSLPTENGFYVFLRKVFKVEKPWDHFHTGEEVEAHLRRSGFKRITTSCVPLHVRIAPLFLITAWRRE